MQSSLRLQNSLNLERVLEWTTKKPKLLKCRVSPVFSFQSTRWRLKLVFDPKGQGNYVIYMLREEQAWSSKVQKEFQPFEVTTYIVGPDDPINICRKIIKTISDSLYSIGTHYIIQRMQDPRYFELLRFVMTFHGDLGLTLYEGIKDTSNTACPSLLCLEDLSTDYEKLFNDTSSKDITVKCGEATITADKCILRVRSKFFERELQTNTGRQVDITGYHRMDQEILKSFILYLYTGKLPEMTPENARCFYEIGALFGVDSLRKQCMDFLMKILTTENAGETFLLAERHRDHSFKVLVMSKILENDMPQEEKSQFLAKICNSG